MIREREVRLLGEDRELIGMMSSSEAMDIAQEQGLDLVCIAPEAKPPVCRIMDYKKFKFDGDKKAKEAVKKQKTLQVSTYAENVPTMRQPRKKLAHSKRRRRLV
jgi:translation initiation factor IF-3